ncbi:MAG: type II toxin-antitoxin system PemK/MazF family toxin, partial [Phormidesmis sp.]
MTPKRGEVWLVNLDPTLGSEIKKTRPAIVISADKIGKLPVKLIVPITDWKTNFAQNVWHIKMKPTDSNGLSKTSAADTLQMRSIDLQRFIRK